MVRILQNIKMKLIVFWNNFQDVGEGYYEPIKSIIYEYDGNILRTPSEAEVKIIIN